MSVRWSFFMVDSFGFPAAPGTGAVGLKLTEAAALCRRKRSVFAQKIVAEKGDSPRWGQSPFSSPYDGDRGRAARGMNSSAAMPRSVSQDLQPGHCQRNVELSRPHSLQR